MPDADALIRNAGDRAAFFAALAEARGYAYERLDAVRASRARHHQAVESVAVELRILREHFNHRNPSGGVAHGQSASAT
jgi:hypothetical protein